MWPTLWELGLKRRISIHVITKMYTTHNKLDYGYQHDSIVHNIINSYDDFTLLSSLSWVVVWQRYTKYGQNDTRASHAQRQGSIHQAGRHPTLRMHCPAVLRRHVTNQALVGGLGFTFKEIFEIEHESALHETTLIQF
jgi:hypothetical protein